MTCCKNPHQQSLVGSSLVFLFVNTITLDSEGSRKLLGSNFFWLDFRLDPRTRLTRKVHGSSSEATVS